MNIYNEGNILEKIKNKILSRKKLVTQKFKDSMEKEQKENSIKNKFCYSFALKVIRECINKYPAEFKCVKLLNNHDKELITLNFDDFITGVEYLYPVAKVDKEMMTDDNKRKINKILDNYNKILKRKGCNLYCTNRYGNFIILYNK